MVATLLVLASGGAAAQMQTPTQQEEARCIAEERHRDSLALRRFVQRTRAEATLREACKAEVARAFDDRILGRPRQPGPPPIGMSMLNPGALPVGNAATGTVGSQFVIQGAWHHVGVETGSDNRYAYFIESTTAERGPIAHRLAHLGL